MSRNSVVKKDPDADVLNAVVASVQASQQDKKKPSQEKMVEEAIAHILGELGKQRVKEDELLFEGTQFILPAQYAGRPKDAISFLENWVRNQNKTHEFSREYPYRPFDVGYAFLEVMKELTGTKGLGVSTYSFFGEQKPQFVSINVDVNKTTQIPWGSIGFPQYDATFHLGHTMNSEYGAVGVIGVECPKRHQAAMEGIFTLVERYLKQHSLYRGKAIYGNDMNPEFMDLSTVDPSKVVYSAKVLRHLEANVWTPIRHTDRLIEQGVTIKRSVLFGGPYGTGKTLGCLLTAQIAVENGWTFIQCRIGKDDPAQVMKTAQLYATDGAGVVVVVEDFDANLGTSNKVDVSKLLEMLDGASNKGRQIIGIFTTNHVDQIQKGALRPGRIDAVIEIDGLDAEGFRKLITLTLDAKWMGSDIDWDAVAEAFDGFLPAFVKEAAERAQRYAMAENDGKPSVITTEDLVLAANSLRPQLDLMTEAKEGLQNRTLDTRIQELVEGVNNRTSLPGAGTFVVEPASLLNGAKN